MLSRTSSSSSSSSSTSSVAALVPEVLVLCLCGAAPPEQREEVMTVWQLFIISLGTEISRAILSAALAAELRLAGSSSVCGRGSSIIRSEGDCVQVAESLCALAHEGQWKKFKSKLKLIAKPI